MKYGRIIGKGNTATVYDWKEDKVLKLFYQGYPKEAVEKELHNVKAISKMTFAKPKAYEMVECDDRIGIIYDRVEGELLQEWVKKTRDAQGCAVHMSKLHKEILKNKICDVPSYKEFLERNLLKITPIDSKVGREALNLLDKLQEGESLCHGDFHPGNIFIAKGQTTAIDFMNICRGPYLYDIARTVFLVQYTPVPMELEERELVIQSKKYLVDLYLKEMNVTREMIKEYLIVIIAARKGECPSEGIGL